MNFRKLKILSFIIFLFAFSIPAFAQLPFLGKDATPNSEERVEVTADQLEYFRDDDKVVGKGNVVVIHGEQRLIADYAEVYTEKKIAYAKGHVILFRGDDQYKGDEVEYDFANSRGTFPDGRVFNKPFYGEGTSLEQLSKDKAILDDGFFSICQTYTPNKGIAEQMYYGVRAEQIIIYPDDKLIAKNCSIEVLGKRIFWWPYLVMPLNSKNAPIAVETGYTSDWGGYALFSKGFAVNKNIDGKLRYDYRSKRGHAAGLELDYTSELLGNGEIEYYNAWDKEAPNVSTADPEGNKEERGNRYRMHWNHRKNFSDYSHIVAEFNKLDDQFLLKDFFEDEYDEEPDPETYVTYTKNGERYGFVVNVEKQVNSFDAVVEKLPEVRFNWNNQKIPNTPLYFKNETSFAVINNTTGSKSRGSPDRNEIRQDTFNEISYPKRIKKININVRPKANIRGTYYNKNNLGTTKHWYRHVIGGGGDIDTRFYRIFDINGNFGGMEINQLRHMIEPSVSYTTKAKPNHAKRTILQIDEVDDQERTERFTYGLRNKLQTKRNINGNMKRVDLFTLSNELVREYQIEPDGWQTFETKIEFRPFSWLIMYHRHIWDLNRSEFFDSQTDIELKKPGKWRLFISHNYDGLPRIPASDDEESSLLTLDFLYKVNQLWNIGWYTRHDFEDNNLEEIQIRFLRDLRCWLLEFGFNQRNDEGGAGNDVGAFFQLILKAFPEYRVGDGNRASFSRARFGDLVSGAHDSDYENDPDTV